MDSTNAKTSTCSLMTEPDNVSVHRAAANKLTIETRGSACNALLYAAFQSLDKLRHSLFMVVGKVSVIDSGQLFGDRINAEYYGQNGLAT